LTVHRLPDGVEIFVVKDQEQFSANLAAAFPECANAAIDFYRNLKEFAAATKTGELVSHYLNECSLRFRRFIDVQLQTLAQRSSDECSYDDAARELGAKDYWGIKGSVQALADSLAKSLKTSGGSLRLNSPVLRFAYGPDGSPSGVDLLSGERVLATRALISNLTVWDTYGKLIGMRQTPPAVSSQLRQMRAWGAYQIFLSMERPVAERLSSRRILALTDWQQDQSYNPEYNQFVFSLPADFDERGAEEKVPVSLSAFTNVEDWFSFHQDHSAHEEQDQSVLETLWSRLHSAMPELGDSVEVVETATPQTFYESTRRKFGVIGQPSASFPTLQISPFPNVFLVSDTAASSSGLTGVVQAALNVADLIRPA
jgi:phytoene dehydrogenase-like protein